MALPYFLFTGKESRQRKAVCRVAPLSLLDRFHVKRKQAKKSEVSRRSVVAP